MKTLMHICCAPCANQPIEVLRTDGFEVTGFWYNPNIHPVTEYRARRNCLQAYAEEIELPLIVRNDYGRAPLSGRWRRTFRGVASSATKCACLRPPSKPPREALTASPPPCSSAPYQKHELMREVAERAAAEYGVQFLYRDFRPYFRAGQEFAREHGFYMQKYCGCIFSEEERYMKPKKILP